LPWERAESAGGRVDAVPHGGVLVRGEQAVAGLHAGHGHRPLARLTGHKHRLLVGLLRHRKLLQAKHIFKKGERRNQPKSRPLKDDNQNKSTPES